MALFAVAVQEFSGPAWAELGLLLYWCKGVYFYLNKGANVNLNDDESPHPMPTSLSECFQIGQLKKEICILKNAVYRK